jgi:hypothetical protein
MSKKNLFISAALTAFVLVVVANVTAVYAQIREAATSQPVTAATEMQPAQTALVQVTHQEAASIAAGFLGQSDIYSVENTSWNGIDAYKVVFSSGHIVYVNLEGQIIGNEAPQPVFVSVPAQNNGVNQSQSADSPAHTEDHDEHEEHDDDDDDD